MDRKHFFKNSVLGGSALLTASGSFQKKPLIMQDRPIEHTFNLNYAPHFGMFSHLAGNDLIDQIKFMADVGFTAIEDNGMMGRSPETQERIGNELARQGMDMGVFVLDKGGNSNNSFTAGKKEYTEIFLDGCRRALMWRVGLMPRGQPSFRVTLRVDCLSAFKLLMSLKRFGKVLKS